MQDLALVSFLRTQHMKKKKTRIRIELELSEISYT